MAGCGRTPETPAREYQLQGQILAVRPERSEVVIKHQDIKGFMPGMTMPFKVKDGALLQGKEPGDLVTATLVVGEVDAHLRTLEKTGHAALDTPAPPPPPDIRQPGDTLTDATLVDQNGAPASLSRVSWPSRRADVHLHALPAARVLSADGSALRRRAEDAREHAGARRREAGHGDARSGVRHAGRARSRTRRRRGADPKIWSFLTGDPAEVNQFGSQLGIYVEHNPQSAIDITHNLRTVVIDPDGRLVKVHNGNSWTPSELVADLSAVPAPTN